MALKKYRIGELIEPVDERNEIGIKDFYGININKEFMPTAANTEGLDEKKYKVVRTGRFVFSGMQTGRDECIRISMYTGENPILISPAYMTFEIKENAPVIPTYFFMIFKSPEMDRYGAFCSDGSIRSNLDWDVFCEIVVSIPSFPIQQKYVNVYNAMLTNQKSYERGLNDLKIVLEGYLDNLKNNIPHKAIGPYIELCEDKNEDLYYDLDDVRGISIEKKLIETKADMTDVGLRPYYLLRPNDFAYVTVTSRNGGKISLAMNNTKDTYICSSSYVVFRCKDEKVLYPEYLMLYFSRLEFNRYARYNSWGSARETFDWSEMCAVKIPIPDISIQKAIANIYCSYIERKRISEQLKILIKDICPILIKGSLEDAK